MYQEADTASMSAVAKDISIAITNITAMILTPLL